MFYMNIIRRALAEFLATGLGLKSIHILDLNRMLKCKLNIKEKAHMHLISGMLMSNLLQIQVPL